MTKKLSLTSWFNFPRFSLLQIQEDPKEFHVLKNHLVQSNPPTVPFHTAQFVTAKEAWFFMKVGQKFERKDQVKDVMKLEAQSEVDKTILESMIDSDDGILRAGLLPSLDAATSAGSKTLLDSISKDRLTKFQVS